MRGFILNTHKVKEEDLVVKVLTDSEVLTLYRFYGARHSYINIGYLIDFEIESSIKSKIDRLKDVMQIGFDFLLNRNSMIIWQQYIQLISYHLKDVEEVPDFYFYHLDKITKEINRNPKRVIIENFIELLEYEGRLHNDFLCFNCDCYIEKSVVLIRAFLPACKNCVKEKQFSKDKIETLFASKKSLLLDDSEIDCLYNIILKGV
jgi:recombinational DNA repair protein (RecF pathway)